MKRYIVDIFVLIALVIIFLFATEKASYTVLVISRLLITGVTFVFLARSFKVLFYDNNISKKIKSYVTLFVALLICFIILENTFMFIPRSHGAGYTLGSKVWSSKYANDINFLGYRDFKIKNDKQLILFAGDSFTWGHGIKKIKDRFSNIVGNKIDNYNTANIGVRGFDSKDEYENLLSFVHKTKIKPDKIVLQYFGNDIEKIAIENGITFKGFTPYKKVNVLFKSLIKNSFLFNYLYWLYPQDESNTYLDFLETAYNDEYIFEKHSSDLSKFIDYAQNNSVELLVVVFPFLQDIPMSEDLYTEKIVKFFNTRNIKTIDMAKLLYGFKTKDLVVNSNDSHPSAMVNKIVADEIIKILKEK